APSVWPTIPESVRGRGSPPRGVRSGAMASSYQSQGFQDARRRIGRGVVIGFVERQAAQADVLTEKIKGVRGGMSGEGRVAATAEGRLKGAFHADAAGGGRIEHAGKF